MRRVLGGVVALGAVAALVLAGVAAYRSIRGAVPSSSASASCHATVDGHTVELDSEQAENAALIAAIGVGRQLPARAVSIALATAYQESKIYNLDTGDRDSLGLFQQRPSQGWGTRAEVQDPVHATNAFYDALVKVDGYQTMPITDAAQLVQRSGYPQAYARHEADARALASALTGNSPHAFSCTVPSRPSAGPTRLDDRGLTPRAAQVADELGSLFGQVRWTPAAGGRSVVLAAAPGTSGWAMAQYVVAQASRLHVDSVSFAGLSWDARRSGEGWRPTPPHPGLHITC